MTKVQLKGEQMHGRSADLRELFKGILSDNFDTHKRAKDKLSRWLWEHPNCGMKVKRNFSHTNFYDSEEFDHDSLQETFEKFDSIIEKFLVKYQITFEKLENISEEQLGSSWINYFNMAHYNKACDLYRQWQRKSNINGRIVFSLDQDKNDDSQNYKEEIPDHKNLNDLDHFNLGDLSEEAMDKLPIFNDSREKLRNCSKKVDCLEIAVLGAKGYNQTEVAKKFGVHKSKISRHWREKCLKCINQIIAENNME
ncbi:MAG: hypothetical protein MGG11_20910 [Trichodesmium sp. MAG_R03]|nr:hypothetical protein [Trichodesmium sp. MAG_R03]